MSGITTNILACLVLCTASSYAQKLCDVTSIGLAPLTEMRDATWNGVQGGLYPNGSNLRPFEFEMALRDLSTDVYPATPAGEKDNVNGKLGILALGSSDAQAAFEAFTTISKQDTLSHRGLVYINGCTEGMSVSYLTSASAPGWSVLRAQVDETGLTAKQLSVAWVMLDDLEQADTVFPRSADSIANNLARFCRALMANYPGIRLVYFSSRPYSGYIDPTETSLPEACWAPRDYIYGWGVKKLIERQINEHVGYRFMGETAEMPALSWSAYLWADGTTAREDGLQWDCEDFLADGYTLSEQGAAKAGSRIHNAFSQDLVARGWYTQKVVTSLQDHDPKTADSAVWTSSGAIHLRGVRGSVSIRDLRGTMVWNGVIDHDRTIRTDAWAKGTYVVVCDASTATVLVR